MKFTLKTAAVIAAATFIGQSAFAATVDPCGVGSGLACLADGNDNEASVEANLADALGLASIDLTLLGKSDDGYGDPVSGQDGSWATPDAVDYVTIKAATSYTIYAVGGASSGSWTTMGILNNGGKQPDVSHISYWSGGSTVVPLPAAGWLLLAGLGGLFALRRKS